MKVLIRKIKRANKLALTIYIISLTLFLSGYIYFAISLFKLAGIETLIRIILLILFIFWFIIYFLFGLSTLVTKKLNKFLILSIVNIILFIVILFSSIIIHRIYSKLEMFTSSEYTKYTTNLISLKDTELTNESVIGMISNNEDIEGYILANTLKNKENLNQQIEYFDDYYAMINALYEEEIDAAFVSGNYTIIFSNEKDFEDIEEETKIIYEYSEVMKTKSVLSSNKSLNEPFTVLLMGVDSNQKGLDDNAIFNGDTLMLVTFNPETLNATMLSLPRDTYVPIACNNNRYHKINSSAAYGTECVINTVQNLVGIPIDYYAKINFRGVISLVDAVGGIDVDVEAPNYSSYINTYGEGRLCESNYDRDINNLVCMNTGWQHLNGEQALAYARNRHGFLESDLARNRHQQQIVEAVAKKVIKFNSFNDFEGLLFAVAKNTSTNLSTNQMLSFYQTLKNMLLQSLKGNDFLKIEKAYLEVYSLPVMIGDLQLSALGYHENSLEAIKNAMEVNLGLKEEEMIKTFTYDYNEEYETPILGKGITGGTNKTTTVPNFIGSTVRYAEDFGKTNNITINKTFACSNGIPGIIGNQNVLIGTPISEITSITITINQVCNDDNDDEQNEDNNENTNTPTPPNKTDNNDNNQDKDDNDSDDDTPPKVDIPGSPTNPKDDNDDNPPKEDEDNKDNENEDEEPTIPGNP